MKESASAERLACNHLYRDTRSFGLRSGHKYNLEAERTKHAHKNWSEKTSEKSGRNKINRTGWVMKQESKRQTKTEEATTRHRNPQGIKMEKSKRK
ncbi:hypothetical protein EVAR_90441_1 [Eumeta japonica]|uniref:Uncharacterized protein n=1 Tax=Eumeta variegata TaxID=151549 RepID=A0A4C1SHK1_EUMVA|nr:hypothetical protein EVAR_90441_1 [Eumeta japonica]